MYALYVNIIIIEELPRAPEKQEMDYIKLSLNLSQGSLHILRCNDHQRCAESKKS